MKQAGFRHEALIYEGEKEYLAGTVPFLIEGIEAGEQLLVAVGGDRAQSIAGALGRAATQRVQFVEMESAGRNPAPLLSLWRDFIAENGGRPGRGISEAAWDGRSDAAWEECYRHETLLNVAFADGPAWSLLCPFDIGAFGSEVFTQAARSHPCIERQGDRAESASFERNPDAFAGDLPAPGTAPMVLRFGLHELADVRQRVAAEGRRFGLDARQVADLVTATSELAANSVTHGGGNGVLRLWREGDVVQAEVTDRGRIEEPLVGRLRPDIRQEGGRGLWLANQLCDLVQIRSNANGTRVRLHLAAPAEGPVDSSCGELLGASLG